MPIISQSLLVPGLLHLLMCRLDYLHQVSQLFPESLLFLHALRTLFSPLTSISLQVRVASHQRFKYPQAVLLPLGPLKEGLDGHHFVVGGSKVTLRLSLFTPFLINVRDDDFLLAGGLLVGWGLGVSRKLRTAHPLQRWRWALRSSVDGLLD